LKNAVTVQSRDTEAYAQWAQKELPTEADWKFVALKRVDRKLVLGADDEKEILSLLQLQKFLSIEDTESIELNDMIRQILLSRRS